MPDPTPMEAALAAENSPNGWASNVEGHYAHYVAILDALDTAAVPLSPFEREAVALALRDRRPSLTVDGLAHAVAAVPPVLDKAGSDLGEQERAAIFAGTAAGGIDAKAAALAAYQAAYSLRNPTAPTAGIPHHFGMFAKQGWLHHAPGAAGHFVTVPARYLPTA